MTAADYRPPRWLRNAHLQSLLGSSPLRRRRAEQRLAELGATTTEHLIDGGEGVRLHGLHSIVPGTESRGLVLLLHGWEGSAESNYMRMTAAELLGRGFEVFRLNFRDHGDTHHLNEGLFHSNRIGEVLHAARDVTQRFPRRPMSVAGYSLGGNFALRLALQAPEAGLPLTYAAAICPVLDPARTMDAMEQGLPIYLWYFERKWRGSLARKRELFPQFHDFDDSTLGLRMRSLTQWMVERHTEYGTLDRYFDGYSVAADRLSRLQVPVSILMAEDDPVIPVEGFRALTLPPNAQLEIAPWGGHCGFLESARLDGFAERWIADRLESAASA
ncbi:MULTISPECIES: alpha/beta fold hydrolase [unclassified Lysobacter]|uniref:YheT family hydrolase n=1 Tax=unclassified Lysobacter TaxID=2635362 RepID=UPI0006F294E7|nr:MULTISPECIES: alpha/beta fold hydrolase [unclassified Lysobacter]KQZ59385.1 alpha/beta hydrolase [Lysobacter sp. Root559]KRC31280.1 alpha/beta hydrolase [Lysobacter sp. Root76]KRD65922.1 alpha/beta hydrolase [Lysobacter sp. Root96]